MKKIIQKYKAYKKDKTLRFRMGDMYLKTYGATWEQIYFVVNRGVDVMTGSYEKEILKRYELFVKIHEPTQINNIGIIKVSNSYKDYIFSYEHIQAFGLDIYKNIKKIFLLNDELSKKIANEIVIQYNSNRIIGGNHKPIELGNKK